MTPFRRPVPFLFLAVAGLASVASAEPRFDGSYIAGTKAYRQELEVTNKPGGGYSVRARVATSGCAGAVEAVGKAEGDLLTAIAAEEDVKCVLTFKRSKTGLSVEEDHCVYFHGASCDFNGDYRKH